MALESRDREKWSTNTVIGYVRAFLFLALGTYLLTRPGYEYKFIGVLFVIYGIWRVYTAYKRSHAEENDETI